MIASLLFLIVLILLFGAAAVRGWLSGTLGVLAAIILIVVAIPIVASMPALVWQIAGGAVALGLGTLFVFDARQKARLAEKISALNKESEIRLAALKREQAAGLAQAELARARFEDRYPIDQLLDDQ